MRPNLMLTGLLLALAPVAAQAQERKPACNGETCKQRLVYIGTRTGGPGNGILAARFDPKTGALTGIGLVAEVERPTWVLPDAHRLIYSVSETGAEAKIYSFSADVRTGALTQISRVSSGGGGATHMAINAKKPSILVANYGTGQVSVVPLRRGGVLLPVSSVQSNYGTGPSPRQTQPHAHGVAIDKGGRFVLASDLGADRIFVYRFDSATLKLSPAVTPFVAARPGSGPRHVVLHPGGKFAYVNSELTSEITSYSWNGKTGQLQPLTTLSTLPPGYTGANSSGEIAVSPDGRFLYASNRGEDTLVVYAIDRITGGLTEIQRIASGGKKPWAFMPDPGGRWLLVANEGSDQVTVFARDPASGKLTATGQRLSVLHPSSIAFLAR